MGDKGSVGGGGGGAGGGGGLSPSGRNVSVVASSPGGGAANSARRSLGEAGGVSPTNRPTVFLDRTGTPTARVRLSNGASINVTQPQLAQINRVLSTGAQPVIRDRRSRAAVTISNTPRARADMRAALGNVSQQIRTGRAFQRVGLRVAGAGQ